jgi:hypothetical protein
MTEKLRIVSRPPDYAPDKMYISEEDIEGFCHPCEMLEEDNTCFIDFDGDNQPNMAVRKYCDRVKIDGQRGWKQGDKFYPSEWMSRVVEEKEKTMGELAVRMVNEVSPEEIIRTRVLVEREFNDWLTTRDSDYEGPGSEPYDGYYANFFIIVPGWSGGGYLTERYEEKGWLDVPHRKIFEENHRSELYRNMTRRLFTGIIYAAIEVEGLSLEKIYKLNSFERNSEMLAKYIMPVLIRLRAMGFTKPDLWH